MNYLTLASCLEVNWGGISLSKIGLMTEKLKKKKGRRKIQTIV